jgi:formylglycine-generating enzyme required for sulfatase activity
MVVIPPGRFLMGSPNDEQRRWNDEGPVHEVSISYAFAAGKYPVTRVSGTHF